MKQDDIWKDTIEKLFNQFVEFFMPDVYPDINFKINPRFLDKEFNKFLPKSKSKNRRADKLVEVTLKNKKKQLLFIHIEVQGYEDKEFAMRMFQYFYRIFDKSKGQDIEAIAIFTDNIKDFKPDRFEKKPYETHISYKYRTYKVIEQDEGDLLKSDNPFALAMLAVLYAIKSKNNDDKKLSFNLKLAELLFKKGYNGIVIEEIFKFINSLLEVNDLMKRNLYFEEVSKMANAQKKVEIKTWFDEYVEKRNSEKTAKILKDEGVDIKIIMKSTGLTKKDIDKL